MLSQILWHVATVLRNLGTLGIDIDNYDRGAFKFESSSQLIARANHHTSHIFNLLPAKRVCLLSDPHLFLSAVRPRPLRSERCKSIICICSTS